ncbi:M20 family metallopeptidase [Blastococcus saxobsidens]|uniref:Acetylornithine deacetylase/succinyldiaminopimelate desuccinylase-like deacylase n=1 Tax=Blastococcus saxobsidens (strain DD2) TaxID=1146883 RepID=H6RV61_BLASD|nr:M20/M25/M40 family metallo-hydrolase [Blastococcus saxobsidens]CCG05780.1 Acetylornithine deacetylase/succinyldiaminopimelate desuccinylase-like deacylase [Blastococcus saxobsidens DD2]
MAAAGLDRVALLRELVGRVTVSGDSGAQRDAMGMVTEVVREGAPHLEVTTGPDRHHPWTLLSTPTDPARSRLLLACHVDTVPAADPGSWQRDPFGADLDGGRVWGRGTSDMKAGVVAAAAALAAADPETPLALLLTSDEEIGSHGAAAAAAALAGHRVGAVVIPEATGNQVVLGHRGALWLAVRTAGRAAHGSTPERGHNAVLDLVALLARVQGALPLRTDPFLGSETWNPGVVAGGSVPNVVPDGAEVLVDMRTVGDGRQLLAWWRDQPEVSDVEVRVDLPPVRTAADDPWVSALPAPVLADPATYFTDASVLAPAVAGAPIVVWGPGTPAVMHARDEYVELAELHRATALFAEVAARWPG